MKSLLVISGNKRPWGFLLMAALAVGIPAFIGAGIDRFSTATIGSMGGLVILYMGQTAISHRMATLGACAFGFILCFSSGLISSFNPYFSAFSLWLTALIITAICRYVALPPPGSFFFILIACLGRTLPFDPTLAMERTAVLLLGCMGACLLALIYSFFQACFFSRDTLLSPPPADPRIEAIFLEATVIASFIGGSYLLALLVELENPYWVPVSCAAILQGASFRDTWHRNVHRILGTIIGMGLAWIIFSFSPGVWELALLITVLSFIIEILITRNYGLAVIFITPLTILFAEASSAIASTNQLIVSRLLDIVLGSSIGYLGGWLIHHPRGFSRLEQWLARLRH